MLRIVSSKKDIKKIKHIIDRRGLIGKNAYRDSFDIFQLMYKRGRYNVFKYRKY